MLRVSIDYYYFHHYCIVDTVTMYNGYVHVPLLLRELIHVDDLELPDCNCQNLLEIGIEDVCSM